MAFYGAGACSLVSMCKDFFHLYDTIYSLHLYINKFVNPINRHKTEGPKLLHEHEEFRIYRRMQLLFHIAPTSDISVTDFSTWKYTYIIDLDSSI